MSGYGSTAPLCSILYRFRANGDCNLLCVRLLLFFFVNSHNRNKHLQFFVASGGVPVLITLLRRFVRKEAIARSYLCELFSLLYLLAQNRPSLPLPSSRVLRLRLRRQRRLPRPQRLSGPPRLPPA